jgi:hypothetical protein
MEMDGPSEEAGRAARSFIEVMKGEPIALSLVVMNVLLLGFLYYTGIVAHEERKTEMQLLYENRSEMAKLLYECTPRTRPESGQH